MRNIAIRYAWIALTACSDHATPSTVELDAGRGADAAQGTDTITDGGPADLAHCNLSGRWIARMNTKSIALQQDQFANNWYYFEFTQRGSELEISQHLDCGIEVQGSVTVQLTPATTRALMAHNRQVGRKGSVTPNDDGTCTIAIERFWSVRGVSEAHYLPTPRSTNLSVEALAHDLPLPALENASLTEDWDGDGQPGVAWTITTLNATRHSAQRDWTRYFTAPGYAVTASTDFVKDLLIRAEFSMEEVVYAPPALSQAATPDASAPHTLTLRFLGRTAADARSQAIIGNDDMATCTNARRALPPVKGLR